MSLNQLLPDNVNTHQEVLRLILQYLDDHQLFLTKTTLQDEANLAWHESHEALQEQRRLSKAVEKGEWENIDKILSRGKIDEEASWLVWRQVFLEYCESHDSRALSILQKRLKPMEHLHPEEFRDLCYVLTARSVKDVARFASWDKQNSRQDLLQRWENHGTPMGHEHVPPERLLTLLRQAVAWQVSRAKHPPTHPVSTLLKDWIPIVVPDSLKYEWNGHDGNIKAVAYVDDSIASGGSDGILRIWNSNGNSQTISLDSRIWNLHSRSSDSILAALASGRSVLSMLDINGTWQEKQSFQHSDNDVYASQFHPGQRWIATGGYDKDIKVWDVETGRLLQNLQGHNMSVSSLVFNPIGNLLISGGKDSCIKFWDLTSGSCVRTWSSHLGPVTSVDVSSNGALVLSASKDSSNRLWDVRQSRPLQKYRGHQNTSKNFIRAKLVSDEYVVSGSEDGKVYWWDMSTAKLMQTLGRVSGPVYDVVMSSTGFLASGSEDGIVRVWEDSGHGIKTNGHV